ncbi:3' 5'-cyclic adenosine monophosphate phosphodiesterase CpdA [termite gut metagenome]|uniref:3' 5'-cyclic adenosine monophosphate phosphodiesterase CpdA n=1 Tax=termite gut metagenome TaxID=433724 RepID=A0A5J4SFY5_9ZZZZ
MKKSILIILCLFVTFLCTATQKPARPELKFRADGTFKIMQITDTHYRTNWAGREGALDLMKQAIPLVNPDLVILTGDIVSSNKDTYELWTELTQVLVDAKVPWALVFGNHDDEFEITKPQIIEMITNLPYCLVENGPKEVAGNGNYVLKIASSTPPSKTKATIYCFDFPDERNGIMVSQLEWYRQKSTAFTAANGNKPLPSLAFFHIPIPEYREVIDIPTTVGQCNEEICNFKINSGVLANFIACKDVMGTFVGHDHSNNYIGCLHDVCLAYGYCSGKQVANPIAGRGVRIIELFEGERKFNTWLLKLYDSSFVENRWKPVSQVESFFFVTYPDSFKK